MILRTPALVSIALSAAVLLGSCASDGADEDSGVSVVATTTILGDIARNIVGDNGTVEVLFPTGASPHDFQPSSSQVAAIYAADLVVANGLHLEAGLVDVLRTAIEDGVNVIEVAEMVAPVTLSDRQPCTDDDDQGGEEHGTCDPHVWFDPGRDADTATIVAESLADVEPSVEWVDRAVSYAGQLADADLLIVETLSAIPLEDRLIVTNHDSFGYFADRYGFEVIGTVIPGGTTISEPSSADLAVLVNVINETGVAAIFTETTESKALADAIADEVDHEVFVVELYTGSLGEPGSGAETLIGMLTTNAERIAGGLS